jgi:hypothetical protein
VVPCPAEADRECNVLRKPGVVQATKPVSRDDMRVTRLIGAMLAALLLAPLMAIPSAIAGTEDAEVVFRVTLEGPVPASHTFAIQCGPDAGGENLCFSVEDIVVVCSPPDDTYNYDVCEPKTYEVVTSAAVGQRINYELLQWTTPNLAHTEDQPEEHLPGSWTVQKGRQVISLGFIYPGGEPAAPALPDTAMRSGS